MQSHTVSKLLRSIK